MTKYKYLGIAVVLFLFAGLQATAFGQTSDDSKLASVSGAGSIIRWDVVAQNAGGTLTITTPDNRSFRRNFRAGTSPEISLTEKQLEGLPDGVYTYEVRLNPVLTATQKETLARARGNDDDPEAERAGRKRPVVPAMVQSGSFAILNGSIIVGGAVENERTGKANAPRPTRVMSANTVSRLFNHRVALGAMPDDVIADDLIVQGSACIGLDCVNNESFSFDTIRLKENNTRISFMDTSTSAGFPTEDWTIRANASGSGGASFLAFVDRGTTSNGDESGTIVFEVDAGAAANALRVSSGSKVGLRTATPVLDVHMNTSDTPAIRFEQNNSGGFSAQTWDIGANEANWFVRDVTGGSRLPLRIRPGAPTSSIDISASGNVGIGTASPAALLDVNAGSATGTVFLSGGSGGGSNVGQLTFNRQGTGEIGRVEVQRNGANDQGFMAFYTKASAAALTERMRITEAGNVGIGTTSPDQKLSISGDADKSAGGASWGLFSDERLKDIKGSYSRGLSAVMGLQPVRFSYKKDNALKLQSDSEIIGFSAQALQKLVPEAVTKSPSGYLVVHSDAVLWAMLNAIKEQQAEIQQLKGQIQKLRTAPRRRHR